MFLMPSRSDQRAAAKDAERRRERSLSQLHALSAFPQMTLLLTKSHNKVLLLVTPWHHAIFIYRLSYINPVLFQLFKKKKAPTTGSALSETQLRCTCCTVIQHRGKICLYMISISSSSQQEQRTTTQRGVVIPLAAERGAVIGRAPLPIPLLSSHVRLVCGVKMLLR